MDYRLGIDLGTTFTAAAVLPMDAVSDGAVPGGAAAHGFAPEAVLLGDHAAVVPSLAYRRPDGSLCFGEQAQAAAAVDPEGVARHFKRRVGDPIPLVLGPGTHIQAHDLVARMIAWVVAEVARFRGGPARSITVTHPAGWSSRQRQLLRTALADEGLERLDFVTEPEAAAIGYAFTGLIEHPASLAVYDLGGGTLDVAVLTTAATGGFTRLGAAAGIREFGGLDFDDVVLRHLLTRIDRTEWLELSESDPELRRSVAALRAASTRLKEALSETDEAAIAFNVDGVPHEVVLTRADFEAWVRELVEVSVQFFADAVHATGLGLDELTWVLLTGGATNMPLVTELMAEALAPSVRIVRALDPKVMVAGGAALATATDAGIAAAPPARPAPVPRSTRTVDRGDLPPPAPRPAPPPGRSPAGALDTESLQAVRSGIVAPASHRGPRKRSRPMAALASLRSR